MFQCKYSNFAYCPLIWVRLNNNLFNRFVYKLYLSELFNNIYGIAAEDFADACAFLMEIVDFNDIVLQPEAQGNTR